jgi:hypothetical protein
MQSLTQTFNRLPTPQERPKAWLAVFVALLVALIASHALFVSKAQSAGLLTYRQAAIGDGVGVLIGLLLWRKGVFSL